MKEIARILRQSTQEIIDVWEERVRRTIMASQSTTKIALYDHLPLILEDLADLIEEFETLDDPYKDQRYQNIIDSSIEHGRHRATTPHYTLEGLVNEYIVFHWVITELLRERGVEHPQIFDLIKYSLETAILKSVDSFSQSIEDMQARLMGTLAHDIRNPLSTAKLAVEMLGMDIDQERREKLRNMSLSGINKALKLIEELLGTISVKAGEGMSFNFDRIDILKEVQGLYREAKEIYSVPLELECAADKIEGVFDPTTIRRSLENLITNAIKYGSRQQPITIRLADTGKDIELSVHNYGNPIPEEKQQNIFNFLKHGTTKTDGHPQSWGIGLTLVKMVAEAHGGSVKLDSNKMDGTTFTIILDKQANEPGKVKARVRENV